MRNIKGLKQTECHTRQFMQKKQQQTQTKKDGFQSLCMSWMERRVGRPVVSCQVVIIQSL